jgi:hypothetical protein
MRTLFLTCAFVCAVAASPVSSLFNQAGLPDFGSGVVTVQAQDAKPGPQINVEINRPSGRAWYANPVWMAIGGLALVVVILLIVMASRGGGTTVVKG